jgi:hypothetical protein
MAMFELTSPGKFRRREVISQRAGFSRRKGRERRRRRRIRKRRRRSFSFPFICLSAMTLSMICAMSLRCHCDVIAMSLPMIFVREGEKWRLAYEGDAEVEVGYLKISR